MALFSKSRTRKPTISNPSTNTKPTWDDMSDYVVHFTKDFGGVSAYWNMIGILSNRTIEARTAFGIGRTKAPIPETQKCVCFSEVPAHLLSRIAKNRSPYGIGFRKGFVLHHDANPILYAYKDGSLLSALNEMMDTSKGNSDAPIWRAAPFVDAPGKYAHSNYFFEWEREWRKVGRLSFSADDVAFLIIPADSHEGARDFFAEAKQENTGPSYSCPFVDPYWSKEQVRAVLSKP